MKKGLRISFNAPITLIFVGLMFLATLLGVLSSGRITQAFFMTYRSSFASPLTYLRLFTHVLGHGGWSHFIGNAAYILLLGPVLEEKYSGKRLILVILITALVTGLINAFFFPTVGLCGASGVVFAFIFLMAFVGFRNGEIPLTFILVAVIFLGQQVYEAIAVNDNISNLAHIIGGITGGAAGWRFNKK